MLHARRTGARAAGARAARAHKFCAVEEREAGLPQLRSELFLSLHFGPEISSNRHFFLSGLLPSMLC